MVGQNSSQHEILFNKPETTLPELRTTISGLGPNNFFMQDALKMSPSPLWVTYQKCGDLSVFVCEIMANLCFFHQNPRFSSVLTSRGCCMIPDTIQQPLPTPRDTFDLILT